MDPLTPPGDPRRSSTLVQGGEYASDPDGRAIRRATGACLSRLAVRRLAILLSSHEQPQWVATLLSGLLNRGCIEISYILVPKARGCRRNQTGPAILWRVWRRLDAFLFRDQGGPLRTVDMRSFLTKIPRIDLPPANEPAFDAALDLSGAAPEGLTASLAPEVWTYRAIRSESLEPLAAWSRFNRTPAIRTELVSRDRSGSSVRIYEARSAVDRWSDLRTIANCYQKAPAIIAGGLAGGGMAVALPSSRDDGLQENSCQRSPSNAQVCRLLTVFCRRYAGDRLSRTLHHRQWELAVAPLHQGSLGGLLFHELRPPNDRFWADPFPVMLGGRCCVFFEEFSYGSRKGRIMAAECGRRGFLSDPECVLEKPYHLSYPLIFENRGALYMIPETRANRTIELYACTSFPRKWELCRTLFRQIDASDPTPAFIRGRWWLFTNVGTSASAYDNLYLFHAEDPLGDWAPHRGNPVKSDVRSGRSAGRIVIADGKVFRLSQDCSRRYGFAVNAHEITRLDQAAYQERCSGRMTPARCSQGLLGVHTANAAGDLIFIDGLVERSRLPLSTDKHPFRELRVRGFEFWS